MGKYLYWTGAIEDSASGYYIKLSSYNETAIISSKH